MDKFTLEEAQEALTLSIKEFLSDDSSRCISGRCYPDEESDSGFEISLEKIQSKLSLNKYLQIDTYIKSNIGQSDGGCITLPYDNDKFLNATINTIAQLMMSTQSYCVQINKILMFEWYDMQPNLDNDINEIMNFIKKNNYSIYTKSKEEIYNVKDPKSAAAARELYDRWIKYKYQKMEVRIIVNSDPIGVIEFYIRSFYIPECNKYIVYIGMEDKDGFIITNWQEEFVPKLTKYIESIYGPIKKAIKNPKVKLTCNNFRREKGVYNL